jgi:leader peptidase (prepilin peptidase)/N-methyltransferase
MSSGAVGAVVAAASCLGASPYLARLTLSVPESEDSTWWRGRRASSRRVLITAAVAVALGAVAGKASGWSALLPAFVLLALTTTPLTIIDFEHHRLPNRLVVVAASGGAVLLCLAAVVRHDWHPLLRAAEGAAAVFAVLFLIVFVAPRSFGFGDVKLGGVLGGFLGWYGWSYVYYGIFGGFLLGAVVAVALLASGRAGLKTAMALGPMLIAGSLIVLAFGLAPSFTTN